MRTLRVGRARASLSVVAVVLVVALGGASDIVPTVQAHEKEGCTVRSLRGTYGYAYQALFLNASPPFPPNLPHVGDFLPVAVGGRIRFDGEGCLRGEDTVSLAGLIVQRTFTGTYTVKRNCTGTFEFTDQDNNTTHFSLVIVRAGRTIKVIETDFFSTQAFSADKQ